MFWFTIPETSEAHCIVSRTGKMVIATDSVLSGNDRKSYYNIPAGIPYFGKQVRIIDLAIRELNIKQETYEKNQARYFVTSSTKFRVTDVLKASETFTNDRVLLEQLREIIKASTIAVTVKYDVQDVRTNKKLIQEEIRKEIADDFSEWGLSLSNFQVVDIGDTAESKIVSNISLRREVEIETTTREVNAAKVQQAREKEAEANEIARTREITAEKVIAENQQNKDRDIAAQEKLTQEANFDVVQTNVVRQAEIDKEAAAVNAEEYKIVALIKAQQEKDVALIKAEQDKTVAEVDKLKAEVNKEKLRLEGEGTRAKLEAVAKGNAAEILEKLLAEAKGKTELAQALSLFGDEAIVALTAQDKVKMQNDVGVATAKALEKADVKVFSGTGDSSGFDFGSLIASTSIADADLAKALRNNVGVPNDLGFKKALAMNEGLDNI